MSLMGSLYIGTSGLQTSQNALNTTAHNLSNVDTVGYTRQQAQQSEKNYVTLSKTASAVSYQQVGLGTTYSRVKQIRDYFLDKTYREESGRCMFYEVSTNVMSETESLLGELSGEAFQTNVSDLWTSIQELAKDPASSVTQGLLVQRCAEFVERANEVYEGLSNYQDNLNAQIKQQIDKVNDYGKQILELNDKIRSIESGGIEKANDYRDTRNMLLDELSQLVNLSWTEEITGNVSVKIEGTDFVKGSMCYEIGLKQDEVTGFYTPFWPQNAHYTEDEFGHRNYSTEGALVFDLSRTISTELDSDVGGVKAMLLARGDHRANYTDITTDYSAVEQSVIMNIQAEFDQLIHGVTTSINSILAEGAGVKQGNLTLSDGTVLENARYCEGQIGGYLRDDEGKPVQMFSKTSAKDGFKQITATDEYGNYGDYWVYVEESATDRDSLYTVGSIVINQDIMQKPGMLGFRLEDGSYDKETVQKLQDAFSEEAYTLNPKVQKRTNFIEYYSDLVSQVANSGYVFQSVYQTQQDTVEYTQNAREQVIGVSSDEELANMIKLQNAYNASSRYINAVSEMLSHMISTLFS